MRTRWVPATLLAMGMAGAGTGFACDNEDEKDEVKVKLDEVPAAVKRIHGLPCLTRATKQSAGCRMTS